MPFPLSVDHRYRGPSSVIKGSLQAIVHVLRWLDNLVFTSVDCCNFWPRQQRLDKMPCETGACMYVWRAYNVMHACILWSTLYADWILNTGRVLYMLYSATCVNRYQRYLTHMSQHLLPPHNYPGHTTYTISPVSKQLHVPHNIQGTCFSFTLIYFNGQHNTSNTQLLRLQTIFSLKMKSMIKLLLYYISSWNDLIKQAQCSIK